MTERKKSKGGRPKIELDALQIRDVELLAAYLPIERIADYFGMSEKTFRNLKNRDEAVFTAYKRGVAKAHAHAGSILMKFMQYGGDDVAQLQLKFQAAKFYANTKAGWGKDEKSLKINIPEGATPLDIINIAINRISSDGLSIVECKQLIDLAQTRQQLLDSAPPEAQVPAGPSEEFILEHIEKFNEAMRHINEHREREGAAS